MILDILHETLYAYEFAVDVTQHLAHLKPNSFMGQNVKSASLKISPEPGYCFDRVDTFGNIGTFFSIETRHTKLKMIAKSRIETIALDTLNKNPMQSPSWETVKHFHRYRSHQSFDAGADFLFPSPMVIYHPKFLEFASECFSPSQPVLQSVIALMEKIHDTMQYQTASTDVNTLAIESLTSGQGVCQDFAHIMITCLRMLGLSAQYISGYMLTRPPPGKPRLIGSDASHAWVAVFIPSFEEGENATWYHFDPTNNQWGHHSPGNEYVILSKGRDYSDVSPIRGVIHGGGNHQLSVAVTVLPVI